MIDTKPEDDMRKMMKLIDQQIADTSDELLVYMIDKISNELERRSDRHIKYHVERLKRLG